MENKIVGYCVKCKEKREIKEPVETTIKGGKIKAVKGVCSVCGTKMFRIIGKSKPEE